MMAVLDAAVVPANGTPPGPPTGAGLTSFVVLRKGDVSARRDLEARVGPTELPAARSPAAALVRARLKRHAVKVTAVAIVFFENTAYDALALRLILPDLVAVGRLDRAALERAAAALSAPAAGRSRRRLPTAAVLTQLQGWPIELEVCGTHGARRATTKGLTRTPNREYRLGDLVAVGTWRRGTVGEVIAKTPKTLTVRYHRHRGRAPGHIPYAGHEDAFAPTAIIQLFRVHKGGTYHAGSGRGAGAIWDDVAPQAWREDG